MGQIWIFCLIQKKALCVCNCCGRLYVWLLYCLACSLYWMADMDCQCLLYNWLELLLWMVVIFCRWSITYFPVSFYCWALRSRHLCHRPGLDANCFVLYVTKTWNTHLWKKVDENKHINTSVQVLSPEEVMWLCDALRWEEPMTSCRKQEMCGPPSCQSFLMYLNVIWCAPFKLSF